MVSEAAIPLGFDDESSVHIPYDHGARPYHRRVAELVVDHTGPNGSVLDVGCGVGHTLAATKQLGPDRELTAADVDPTCLALTADRVELEATMNADFYEVMRSDQRYDAVVASHVLEHLPRPVDAVHAILQLLKPGGVAVLAVPNPVRPDVILGNLRKRNYANKGHVCCWDRSHWMNFCETIVGADVVEYAVDFVPLPVLSRLPTGPALQRRAGDLMPWLSFSNIAVLRAAPEAESSTK